MFEDLSKGWEQLRSEQKLMKEEMLKMDAEGDMRKTFDKPYVVSDGGAGTYHLIRKWKPTTPRLWKVWCGWRFALSDHRWEERLPEDLSHDRTCGRCLPARRAEHELRDRAARGALLHADANESAEEESSSSSSSS